MDMLAAASVMYHDALQHHRQEISKCKDSYASSAAGNTGVAALLPCSLMFLAGASAHQCMLQHECYQGKQCEIGFDRS